MTEDTDCQVRSYRRVFVALRHHRENLAFSAAQLRKHVCSVTGLHGCEIRGQFGGNGWTEDGIPITYSPNGVHHIFMPGSLEQIAAHSGSHCGEYQGIVLEHRRNQQIPL